MRRSAEAPCRLSTRLVLRRTPANRLFVWLAVALGALIALPPGPGRAALAQRGPAAPPSDGAPALTPEGLVAKVREVYRGSTCSERVTVSVRVADKPARTSVLWVQTCPTPEPAKLWIKAGELRVWGEGKVLRAASSAPVSPFFETELVAPAGPARIDGRMLERVLPALPLPQLDLWSGPPEASGGGGGGGAGEGAGAMARLTAYATSIRWSSVEADKRAGTLRVSGECAGVGGAGSTGKVWLECDARTSRLRRVGIWHGQPVETTITLEISAARAGGGAGAVPPLFEIDTSERARVASMAELAFSAAPKLVGAAMDWGSVQTFEGQNVRGLIRVSGPAGGGAASEHDQPGVASSFRPPRLVLVVRGGRGWKGPLPPQARRALEAVQAVAADHEPVWVVLDVSEPSERGRSALDEAKLEGVRTAVEEIDTAMKDAARHVLWASEPEWGERLAPRDVPIIGVVLNPDQTVRAIVAGDAEDPDGATFADELAALFEAKP